MDIDIKKLGILTTIFTGNKVWPNDAEILSFCQTKMGGNWTDLKQIRANSAELRVKCQEEWTTMWALLSQAHENGEVVAVKNAELHESNERHSPNRYNLYTATMQLEPELYEAIEETAIAAGIGFDELIEKWVREKAASLVPIRAEV